MKALVTGASSGLGYDMAKYLSTKGYDIIAVARRGNLLEKLKKEVSTNVEIVELDLAKIENCFKLKKYMQDIDILINNAGFGLFGEFSNSDVYKELEMVDLNIKAVHILTKLFLEVKDDGYILNVASSAAFAPGPLMATYYASKSYVLRLSESIYEELKKSKSKISISVLCPGPVDTNFNNVAKVHFSTSSLSSEYVSKYAVDKMFKGKLIIIPGFKMKVSRLLAKVLPDTLIAKVIYRIQKAKRKSKIAK